VVRRYEHAAPGDLVHVDVQQFGCIPDGGGHRITDRMTRPAQPQGHHDRPLPARQAQDRLQLPAVDLLTPRNGQGWSADTSDAQR
jgi:hypothetical protein